MPEPTEWGQKQFARLMAELLGKQKKRVINRVQIDPVTITWPVEFWDKENDILIPPTSRMLSAIAHHAAEEVAKDVFAGFAADFVNENVLRWVANYSFELISGLNFRTRRTVENAIAQFVAVPGFTRGDMEELLAPQFGPVRASRIAVTETTRAYAEGNQIAADAIRAEGIQLVDRWNTNADGLVCPICAPRNQKLRGDGWTDNPPAHVNCILPGNLVVAPGNVSAAAKSFYVGGCVEIITANGRKLSVTENHPILTDHGWMKGYELTKGTNVLCATNGERIADLVGPNDNNVPAAIEQIFSALVKRSGVVSVRVPAPAEYFHGDGKSIHGDVNIVYTNSELRSDVTEPVCKSDFIGRDAEETGLLCNCPPSFLGDGNGSAFDCGVSGGNLSRAPFGRHSGPLNGLGLGLAARCDATSEKALAEGPTIDASLAREFVLRFSGDIATDEVVEVRYFDFSGHVYDLQVDDYELYFTNDIITHNCRCWVTHELAGV